MACARVSRQLMRWRRASTVSLALATALLFATAARGQDGSARSVLVIPAQSHWLAAPLSETVTEAVVEALSGAGYEVVVLRPESPTVQRAIDEGLVQAEDVEGAEVYSRRHALAVATRSDVSLVAEVTEGEAEVLLHAELAGAVSRAQVTFEVAVPAGLGRQRVSRELARQLVTAFTPQVWAAAGADEAGRSQGAAERHANGQRAMADGRYREASLEFEAALFGAPDDGQYLAAAAEAQAALGNYEAALARLRRLAGQEPDDIEVQLSLGGAALQAGRPEQAEAAFLAASDIDPFSARAVEGLARAARARGQVELAESRYRQLLTMLPSLGATPDWLPALLASRSDGAGHLAELPPEEVNRQLGILYLSAGELTEGIRVLLVYHHEPERRPYQPVDYFPIAAGLDAESERIARAVQTVLAARAAGERDDEQVDADLTELHDQSDRAATVAERMAVAPSLIPTHRYRVLSHNLLNQSNFEALMYARTQDADRERRAELLRTACRKARAQAQQLGEEVLGSEIAD